MEKKMGNPAVVGLAGFGLTTLLLQFHNIGLCGLGPVVAMGFIFGGLAQMISGFQEQKWEITLATALLSPTEVFGSAWASSGC